MPVRHPAQGEVDAVDFFEAERLRWTEKEFQSALLSAYCGTRRNPLAWKPYHTFFSKNSMAGWPDVALLHRTNGRIVIAELKAEKGKLKPEQEECLDMLRAHQRLLRSMMPWRPMVEIERAFGVYEWRPRHWTGEIAKVLG